MFTSRTRYAAAMRLERPDRVPLMCQLLRRNRSLMLQSLSWRLPRCTPICDFGC